MIESTSTPEIPGYRHATHLRVRFADLDANGHLNHAKYLTFMEHARLQYLGDVLEIPYSERHDTRMVIASIKVDFLLPAFFGQAIIVYTRCPYLGNKSFQTEHIVLADGEKAGYGICTVVSYDYAAGRTVPVPEHSRQRILAYEPASVDRMLRTSP